MKTSTATMTALAIALLASHAHAAAIDARAVRADAVDAASADAADTPDIVVTATKRNASVQDVPLSVSVVGGAAIAERQIRDGVALAREVPNLQAESAMGAAMPRYRLRGIGTDDFTPTTASPVGIYEDEVYIGAGSAQSEPLYDLDRVEVLRGPQGSLWGKNTTAGAIHFVTAKPGDTLSGQGRLSYGSDDTREAELGLGGPLADGLSARVAGVYRHRDGQFYNDFTRSKAGGYDIWDLRGQLLWTFSPTASLLVKGHGGRSKQGQPLQHVGLLPGGADADGYAERAEGDALSNNGPDRTYANRAGVDARLKIDFGGAALTDIAAYETSGSLVYSDDDANPISKYHERYGGKSHTFTNELRVASPDENRFGWIVGAYYLHDRTTSFGRLGLYSPSDFGVNGIAYDVAVRTDNAAGFASLSYRITPQLKITAGGRYTWERKAFSGTAFDYLTNPADVFDASRPDFIYIDTGRGIFNGSDHLPIAATRPHKAWRKPTWDVSLDYKPDASILLYGRIARGFRSGNYNTYIAAPENLSVYDPETLTSYEAGIKTSWLANRVTFNVTGFHYDIDDMQVTVLQNVGTVTQNAASARVNGVEVEASAHPVRGLSLSAGYGFQDSKYVDFPNASVPFPVNQGAPLDLSGQRLERAPRNTLNLNGRYETAVGKGTLSFETSWRYTSRYRFHIWSDATDNNPAAFLATPAARQTVREAFSQDDLWLGDARLAYRFTSGLEIAAWVKNLTSRRYNTNAFAMFFNRSISTYPGERRTAGGSLSYHF